MHQTLYHWSIYCRGLKPSHEAILAKQSLIGNMGGQVWNEPMHFNPDLLPTTSRATGDKLQCGLWDYFMCGCGEICKLTGKEEHGEADPYTNGSCPVWIQSLSLWWRVTVAKYEAVSSIPMESTSWWTWWVLFAGKQICCSWVKCQVTTSSSGCLMLMSVFLMFLDWSHGYLHYIYFLVIAGWWFIQKLYVQGH